ncbi:MAG TPA: 4'-phosphopantetheinyl transferase superfamily protein [Gemmatimonadales bacterium]|jgi:4'-phosphopantetheinyl transferase|nr:4'-phosphopantetheinyl transferase superfamily protein [Gemmatimonadales bacterium]
MRNPSEQPAKDLPAWPEAPAKLTLGRAETCVFSFPLELPGRQLEQAAPVLSSEERTRAQRFRFARDRDRFVAAHVWLRAILGRATGRQAAELELERDAFGKPALRSGGERDQIRFSLSRSDDLGLVAIRWVEEVGVDLERVRPVDDALAIARRMFAAAEHDALHALPRREQLDAFFGYWTRKEAVVKSLGRGLACPLDGFVLEARSDAVQRIELECDGIRMAAWVLSLPAPRPGFVASLAAAAVPGAVTCWAAHAGWWPGRQPESAGAG